MSIESTRACDWKAIIDKCDKHRQRIGKGDRKRGRDPMYANMFKKR